MGVLIPLLNNTHPNFQVLRILIPHPRSSLSLILKARPPSHKLGSGRVARTE